MNQSTNAPQKPKFTVAINTPGFQRLINNTLGDPERAKRFTASIISAVSVNPALQECDAGSILAAAFLGESLNLSPSPQLGQFYLVPFKDKKLGITKAQFVLGYKGYVQLAIRSGQYYRLNVLEIKEGEIKKFNPLTEDYVFEYIEDWEAREAAETVGYIGAFEYVNGFRKVIYWTKKQMMSHADRYSPAFSAHKYLDLVEGRIQGLTLQMIQDNVYISDKKLWEEANKMSSFWYKNFDDMAKKTVIRRLISRWGIMSTEMVTAFERDNSVPELESKNNYIITPETNSTAFTPESSTVVEQVNLEEV
jgi:recombination protein RecT